LTDIARRDELISSGLEIVRESGVQALLPSFTVRELIDRADGATRSAFQHAWPQRSDFEHDVMEEVLAARARVAPASLTSIPRAIDLIETGPDVQQFTRLAYLNAGGLPQRSDLRDRIAATCLASGNGQLAEFALQSEIARQARADDRLVSVLRISGVAFGLEPAEGFTFLDLARCLGALNVGMLMHRIARPDGQFTDFVFGGTPGWSLESVCAHAMVRHFTRPLGLEHEVPASRKPHPSEASRRAAEVPSPRRIPTTRSRLIDAAIEIVDERGISCALPNFTVADLLGRVSSPLTEGAFHHNWPRKVDFENELLVELIDTEAVRIATEAVRFSEATEARARGLGVDRFLKEESFHTVARNALSRPFDPTFMYLEMLVAETAGMKAKDRVRQNFVDRSEILTGSFLALGELANRKPSAGLQWEQLVWIAMAMIDGMQLRLITESNADEMSLDQFDPGVTPSLLGHVFNAIYLHLTEPR